MLKNSEKALLEKRDEELVSLIQEGNQKALEELYIRYKGLIYEISYKYMMNNNVAQMYLDDLIDVATDCLMVASNSFTVGQDWSFLSFWWAITERKQKEFLTRTIEKRITYYDPCIYELVSIGLHDSHSHLGTEGLGVSIIETIHKHASVFTEEELCYLEYYLLGYKPLEIAELFNLNRSRLYRIKKKAMNKLNKIFKSN